MKERAMEKYQKVLSKHILEVALYLQRYKEFLLSKRDFYEIDWYAELDKEFYNPRFKIRIVKSEGNLRRLLNLQITEEIMRTNYKSLTKFKIEGIGIRIK
jgi:hypothetical protein